MLESLSRQAVRPFVAHRRRVARLRLYLIIGHKRSELSNPINSVSFESHQLRSPLGAGAFSFCQSKPTPIDLAYS
jgi:hypothetical protein